MALLLKRRINFPVFLLANLVVDLEPLTVMLLGLDYPHHGYVHTLLIGSLAGLLFGVAPYRSRGFLLDRLLELLQLPYNTGLVKPFTVGSSWCLVPCPA